MSETDPKYYNKDGIQLSLVASEWGLGYHLGCILKYVCRAGLKNKDPLADLRKAVAIINLAFEAESRGHCLATFPAPSDKQTMPHQIISAWGLSERRGSVVATLAMTQDAYRDVGARGILNMVLRALKKEIEELEDSNE